MKPAELSPMEALRRSIGMVVQAAPKELRNLAILNLITGAGPSIALFLGKVVIDESTQLLADRSMDDAIALLLSQPTLLWAMVGAVLLNLFVDSIDSIGTTLFAALRDRVKGYVQGSVLTKVANFDDIALFESPDLLNLLELTEKGLERIQRLSFIVAASLVGVFLFVPSVLVSISIAWWVPLVLMAAAIPSIRVEMKYHKKSWRVEETQAGVTREMDIYSKVIRGDIYAKEIRLFSLQSILLDRWHGLFRNLFNTMAAVRRDEALAVMLWALLGGLGAALPYIYVVIGVLQGSFTLGDLALFTGIILQVRRSLYILIANTGDIYDVALATGPIFQLLDLQPQLVSGAEAIAPLSTVAPDRQGIHLEHLGFHYPGSDRPILHDINLSIRPGEMVALVGENGAGKTTLAKLLCRLYDPSQGRICWNQQDLRSLCLDDLRSRIAVVMQDYARFPALLRENVGWGCLEKLDHDAAIQMAMEEAGLAYLRGELEHGLETPLGKQLENGMELSGGQWQRVAIARSLMRLAQAELLVFDEPTAALDPKNEHEIYQIFKAIAQNRMAVVVSHRLALAKMCDRIIVLEQGTIIEQGSHDELMGHHGVYHTMFSRQKSSYV
ncbi:MAG: ABC transporter ATP-binding protein [Leptolyngbyaceae bacterium]|nr:ABC transporter ATP-binding protein [Leptolyngbyaceae bacterium]